MAHFYQPDSRAYLQYYQSQAGGGGGLGIQKFHGGRYQYGYGLGGLLRSIIRSIIPIGRSVARKVAPVAKSAFRIAQPHLKSAARDIASEAVRTVNKKIGQKLGGGGVENGQTGGRRRRTRRRLKNESLNFQGTA